MRLPTLLPALLAATAPFAIASDATRTAAIYIQPLTDPAAAPSLLAEIAFPDGPSSAVSAGAHGGAGGAGGEVTLPAEVLSYSPPELDDEDDGDDNAQTETETGEQQQQHPQKTKLVRIGVYDPAQARWVSSTSVASAANFAKGYAPHFVLSVDGGGGDSPSSAAAILGVTCRGVAIDAGVTRDFGPQAAVVRTRPGPQPALGKPVVLSPEGKKVGEEGERTFIQKYWWALAIGAFLLLSGGGDEK